MNKKLKLHIEENSQLFDFIFVDDDDDDFYSISIGFRSLDLEEKCNRCGRMLNDQYISIILKLKEAGLIPEEYEMLCCYCWNASKYHSKAYILKNVSDG